MSAPISSINPASIQGLDPGSLAPAASPGGGGAFQSTLADAISSVEHFRENSQQTIDNFLSGGNQELHQVALAAQQSELAFEMFVQVRNKVISAYQEIMRMQL
ncbi:MAG TPA: flagellar hook-basal body complex protein FliE [Bryobacteraceae bacterium]|jgi:flagellar hook-basal body complex protein FliE|nr:flagellar hook-basal body complex protein FliE [Bryobacteraceae bacterium]